MPSGVRVGSLRSDGVSGGVAVVADDGPPQALRQAIVTAHQPVPQTRHAPRREPRGVSTSTGRSSAAWATRRSRAGELLNLEAGLGPLLVTRQLRVPGTLVALTERLDRLVRGDQLFLHGVDVDVVRRREEVR